MICPNCNAEVSDSMKFCENCGAALPASGVSQEPAVQFDQQPAADSFAAAQQPAIDSYAAAQQSAVDPYAAVQQPETAAYTYDQQGSTDPFANTQQPGVGSSTYDQQFGQQPSGDSYTSAYTYDQQQGGQFGGTPTPPGAYSTPTGGQQVSGTPFVLAIIALVTAILGLFPVSIVLAIIALVMNSGQKKRGEVSTKQTPTTVMSIISLVLSALMLIATIALGGLLAAYVTTEGLSSGSGNTVSLSASSKGAGSASASASTSDAPGDLVGTWKLTGLVSSGQTSSADDIALMENMGLTFELTLKEDGTAALTVFGTDMNGTWSSSGAGDVSLTIEGGVVDAKVVGNEIVVSEGEDQLTFTKQ